LLFDGISNVSLFTAWELQPAKRKVNVGSALFFGIERTENLESPSEGSSKRERFFSVCFVSEE